MEQLTLSGVTLHGSEASFMVKLVLHHEQSVFEGVNREARVRTAVMHFCDSCGSAELPGPVHRRAASPVLASPAQHSRTAQFTVLFRTPGTSRLLNLVMGSNAYSGAGQLCLVVLGSYA